MSNKINEVRVINPDVMSMVKEKPLIDSDTIRVYHGFNDYDDAIIAIKFGFSGKERAKRIYSYESNNNPNGLFVTLDFNTAKKFVHPRGERGISVIMELSVKVTDLEAPVWPSGSYTVQGQMAQYWDGEEDRYEKGTLKAREEAKDNQYPFISGADRPEVANSLMGSERQALFTGSINPNMIKSVFFSESGKHGHFGKSFNRISTREFLNKFDSHEPERERVHRNGKEVTMLSNKGQDYNDKKGMLFKPNDDFSMEFIDKLVKDKGYNFDDGMGLLNMLIKHNDLDIYFWPKQIKQIKDMYGDNLNENKIKGGKADKMSKKDISTKFKVTLSKVEKELRDGIEIEKEHTGSSSMAKEIAMDHLVEIPDYYTRLKKMEKEGKKDWKHKMNESTSDYLKRLLREQIQLSVIDETPVSTDYDIYHNDRKAGILSLSTHNSSLPDDAIELVIIQISEKYRGLKLGYDVVKQIWQLNKGINKIYLMPTSQSRGFWDKMGATRLNDTYSVIHKGHS